MQWHKLALIAGAGALAWYALKPKAPAPAPETGSDWTDSDSWIGGAGDWITDTYENATDWMAETWDHIWE